jgi:hypothetical protein|tara:strand:- start:251 stop:418 length:168 start_codon:yes stop_codon:yes gene_type:complete
MKKYRITENFKGFEEWIVEADTENEALDSEYYSKDPDYERHTSVQSIDIEEINAE